MKEQGSEAGRGRREWARAAALGGMWMAARQARGAEPERPETVMNVRQFGAKGDGRSDDTKAIQSALDRAAAVGGSVTVPPGIYRTGELRLRAHVSVSGVPAWDYEHGFGSVIRLGDEHASCLLNLTGAYGTTVDGLALDGGKLGTGVHGVWLNKPDYGKQEDTFRIERCQIANFSGDGVRLTRAWCFSIRHSMIAYNGGDGISLKGWDGFLLDNWLSGNRGAGLAAREENASCTLTGNRVEWNREGVLLTNGDGYNITGNFFDRAGTSGLAVLGGRQMAITGNFFKRSGKTAAAGSHESSQVRLERVRGVTCCGNNLQVGRDDGGKGVWSPAYGIVYQGLRNCVISNNVMDEGAMEQLLLDLGGHGEGMVVKDNPGSLAAHAG